MNTIHLDEDVASIVSSDSGNTQEVTTSKENTELKVENQLLREKISKLDANKEPAENKSQAGLKSLRNIYDSGYHMVLTVNQVKIACSA